jgi:ribosomal protein L14
MAGSFAIRQSKTILARSYDSPGVFVRFDHVASVIVNANHSAM